MADRRPTPHAEAEPGAPTGAPVSPAASHVPWWAWVERVLTTVVRVFAAALLLGIVLVISWQVTARYIPSFPVPRWTEEISLIMMVWLAMFGSGLAVRAGEHLSVDSLTRQLPKPIQHALERLVWLSVAGFGGYLTWYGWELSQRTMMQTLAATQIPVGLGMLFRGENKGKLVVQVAEAQSKGATTP